MCRPESEHADGASELRATRIGKLVAVRDEPVRQQ
jgi:hypothetical protein